MYIMSGGRLIRQACSFIGPQRIVLIILISAVFITLLYFDTIIKIDNKNFNRLYPSSNWSDYWYNEDTKYILDWTTFFGINMTSENGWLNGCPYNCQMINDKSMLKRSHAVLFHIRNLRWNMVPSFRWQEQYYVFYLMEPPHQTFTDLTLGKGFFNLTVSYRRDSDFVATYGDFRKLDPQDRRIDSIDVKNSTEIAMNKTKLIAWFVSSCDSPNKRGMLVKEMQKYVQIDVYGKCGNLQCRDRHFCNDMLKEYKFYLAFENSLCNDYMTEKMYDRIAHYVVPVVLNKTYYEHKLPPKSVISVSDFSTVKELTDYLILLDKNLTLYLEYFQWRREYEVLTKYNQCAIPEKCGFCALCAFLHKNNKEIRIKDDINKWWYIDSQCTTSLVPQILSRSGVPVYKQKLLETVRKFFNAESE